MWKFVTRGIRETFERRANCRTNIYSQPQDPNTKNEVKTNLTCNYKFFAPSFSAYTNGYCGSTKSRGAEDKGYESKWNAKHTWSEAVGWTSVLTVGWVVCQTLCLRRRLFETDPKEKFNHKISHLSDIRVSYILNQILNLYPKHILPVINCVGNNNKPYIRDNLSLEQSEEKWQNETAFGPITVEEALEEARDNFGTTHNLVMGEYELHYGIKALEENRFKDALRHFSAGAKLSSAGSMFNLGLCYELGIGTLVDQTKAVKYYNAAAERGHLDALYNLGVYHAQGKGGLPINVDIARSCFVKAAKSGQTQAQLALDLEQHSVEANEKKVTFLHDINCSEGSGTIKDVFEKLNEHKGSVRRARDNSLYPILEAAQYNERIDDTKNATELFLDMLGLNDRKSLPVLVG